MSARIPAEPPRLSQSIAKVLLSQSPYHAWWAHKKLGGLSRDSKSMDLGTLGHELLMGSDRIKVFPFDSWKKKAAQEARKEARKSGLVPVLQCQVDRITPTVDRARSHLAEAGIDLDRAHVEKRLFWDQHGVPCAGTPDLWQVVEQDGVLRVVDVKFTKTIEPERIQRTAERDWAIQCGAYTCALSILQPRWAGRIDWRWLVCEMEAPNAVEWHFPDQLLQELGERKWLRAVEAWGELLGMGWSEPWPTRERTLTASTWALQKEEQQDEQNI